MQPLDDLVETFHPRATLEGDPVCGALCVKISERHATLLGLNAPLGHAQKTSTEHRRGWLGVKHGLPSFPDQTRSGCSRWRRALSEQNT